MKHRSKQAGFTVFELLFFVLLVAILVGIAYYVGTRHTKTDQSQSSSGTTSTTQASTYEDKTNGYSLQLPAGWSYIKGQVSKLEDGTVDKDTDGNPIINPDRIAPKGESDISTNGITEVMAEKTDLNAKDYFVQNGYGRAYYTGQGDSTPINGYDSYTVTLNSNGGGGDVKVSVVVHNQTAVQFFYYNTQTMNKYVSTCQQIVNSIKFI